MKRRTFIRLLPLLVAANFVAALVGLAIAVKALAAVGSEDTLATSAPDLANESGWTFDDDRLDMLEKRVGGLANKTDETARIAADASSQARSASDAAKEAQRKADSVCLEHDLC